MASGRLYLEFCGEDLWLDPGQQLTIGRCGDLEVDDNPYLHRLLGRFRDRDGVWWFDNLGRAIAVTVRDLAGTSSSTVGPGSSMALVHGEFLLSFAAGPTRYELGGALEDHERDLDLLGPAGLAGTRTLDWGKVGLNADQKLLLLAMCEERLLHPAELDPPQRSNRQRAARLGWTVTKYNRKLDHLCEKLHRAGVPGVHGDVGQSAVDRRRRVVEHALTAGLVSAAELHLLDDHRAAA